MPMASPPPRVCTSRSRALPPTGSKLSANRSSFSWTAKSREFAALSQAHRAHPARRRRAHQARPPEEARCARGSTISRSSRATSSRRPRSIAKRWLRAPAIALRRLTHSQYNNTVRDLLGDRSLPANQFPPEDFVNGFKNQYAAENLSPLLEDAYSTAAEKLAARAFRGQSRTGRACRHLRAARVHRDSARRSGVRSTTRKRAATRLSSRTAGLSGARSSSSEAMLQSPELPVPPGRHGQSQMEALRRCQPPLLRAVGHHARCRPVRRRRARRTRYAAGSRRSPGACSTTRRRSRRSTSSSSQWLRFDRVLTATKDRRAFPNFTPETAIAMTQEARRFVSDLVWNDRNFMELFTAHYGYMNGDLARIYGVDRPPTISNASRFPPNSGRAGLLGQALFLTLTAKPDETSPTARGLFVREQFLCQHVADPPPGVNTNLPPVTEAKPMTNRDRMAMHTTNEDLRRLPHPDRPHRLRLRKVRRHRAAREKLKLTFGQTFGEAKRGERKVSTVELDLDTTGQVAGIPNSAFSSPKELGAVLAASPQCQECVVKQYFRYVSGRTETPADRPMIRSRTRRFPQVRFPLPGNDNLNDARP